MLNDAIYGHARRKRVKLKLRRHHSNPLNQFQSLYQCNAIFLLIHWNWRLKQHTMIESISYCNEIALPFCLHKNHVVCTEKGTCKLFNSVAASIQSFNVCIIKLIESALRCWKDLQYLFWLLFQLLFHSQH